MKGPNRTNRSECRVTSAELVNTLSTPRTAPGSALSPDGTRLYVTAEVAASIDAEVSGSRDERLGRSDCHAGDGPGMPNGLLYVFDTARAITPGQGDARHIDQDAKRDLTAFP